MIYKIADVENKDEVVQESYWSEIDADDIKSAIIEYANSFDASFIIDNDAISLKVIDPEGNGGFYSVKPKIEYDIRRI